MHITADKWSNDHLTINSLMTRGPSRSLLKIIILNQLIVVKFYNSVSTLETQYCNNECMPDNQARNPIGFCHYKVLSPILGSSFLLVYSCMSCNSKAYLKVAEKGGNKQLTEMDLNNMLCVWNYSNKCIGKETFFLTFYDCTDMWRIISVCRGRETTPSGIVASWGISWNRKIQRQWQRGPEQPHFTILTTQDETKGRQ